MNFKSGLMSPPPQMGQNPYDKMMAQQQYGAFKRGQMGAPNMAAPQGFGTSVGAASPQLAIGAMPNSNTAPMQPMGQPNMYPKVSMPPPVGYNPAQVGGMYGRNPMMRGQRGY